MLTAIEKYKAMRKPGTGGAKIHKQIGREIRRQYTARLYSVADDGRLVFQIDTGEMRADGSQPHIKITCNNMPGAVELVACKYERGLPAGFGNGRG